MKYRSEIFQQIHENVMDLYEVGGIDEKTMKEFDESCLAPNAPKILSSHEIYQLRENAGISQSTFADYLNVSKSLVSSWERGVKTPTGAALKLLNIVQQKGIAAIA